MDLASIWLVIEVAATVAFAISGLTSAVRQHMDVVGVFSVAFVSAFGGGTLRDVLLDRRPLFWVEHQEYVWLVLAMTLAAPLVLRAARHQLVDKVTEVTDAFGLGLFAISPPPHGFLGHAVAVFLRETKESPRWRRSRQ